MTSSRSPASSSRFSSVENQGEYHIRSISVITRAASGDEFVVKAAWKGLEKAETACEPVSRVFHDAPALLRKVQDLRSCETDHDLLDIIISQRTDS